MSANVSIRFRNPGSAIYEYMRPFANPPAGIVFNPLTGRFEGTTYISNWNPPITEVIATSVAQINSYINTSIDLVGGLTIKVPAGTNLTTGTITLKKRNVSGYTYLITDSISLLPPITAGNVKGTNSNRVASADQAYMPTINASIGNQPVITCDNGANNYYIRGLAFRNPSNLLQASGYIHLRPAAGELIYANYPNNITVQQCVFLGDGQNVRRAIYLGAENVAIMDNYCDDLGDINSDCQFVLMVSGIGKYRIVNNYARIGGPSENILMGGVNLAGSTDAFLPSDVEIRGNHFRKPSWGSHKNHFEVKFGRRILYEGNVHQDHNGLAQQASIVLKLSDQGGSNPMVASDDIIIRCNVVKDLSSVVATIGLSGAAPGTAPGNPNGSPTRVDILDNILTSGSSGQGIQLGFQRDIRIRHNTIVTGVSTYQKAIDLTSNSNIVNAEIRYNILCSTQIQPSFCVASAVGQGTGETAFAAHVNGTEIFQDNLCVAPASTYANQLRESTRAAIGFTDLAGANYILMPSSKGYRAAPNNVDFGADIPFVQALVAGVES